MSFDGVLFLLFGFGLVIVAGVLVAHVVDEIARNTWYL